MTNNCQLKENLMTHAVSLLALWGIQNIIFMFPPKLWATNAICEPLIPLQNDHLVTQTLIWKADILRHTASIWAFAFPNVVHSWSLKSILVASWRWEEKKQKWTSGKSSHFCFANMAPRADMTPSLTPARKVFMDVTEELWCLAAFGKVWLQLWLMAASLWLAPPWARGNWQNHPTLDLSTICPFPQLMMLCLILRGKCSALWEVTEVNCHGLWHSQADSLSHMPSRGQKPRQRLGVTSHTNHKLKCWCVVLSTSGNRKDAGHHFSQLSLESFAQQVGPTSVCLILPHSDRWHTQSSDGRKFESARLVVMVVLLETPIWTRAIHATAFCWRVGTELMPNDLTLNCLHFWKRDERLSEVGFQVRNTDGKNYSVMWPERLSF